MANLKFSNVDLIDGNIRVEASNGQVIELPFLEAAFLFRCVIDEIDRIWLWDRHGEEVPRPTLTKSAEEEPRYPRA